MKAFISGNCNIKKLPVKDMNVEINDQFNNITDSMKNAEGLTVPPKCFVEMKGKFLEYVEGEFIKISFPVDSRFTNPAGNLLGGMISAYFDTTFGPFSYLETKSPTTSLDLNTTFIRSIHPDEGEIICEARIVKKTKTFIIFEGKAYSPQNMLIATATSRMMILSR